MNKQTTKTHQEKKESCGCAMCQLESIIGAQTEEKHEHHENCGCGHEHHENCGCEHEHHENCGCEHHHHDENCGCGHEHHENCGCEHHHHDENCGCGHEHHGENCGCEHHHHESCGCEHDHHENCGCEHHHHDENCGCGHEHHHHEHKHEHKDGESCGCAMCQLESVIGGHAGEKHEHHHEGCSCGHDHHHEHKDGESCGCAMCQLENPSAAAEPAEKEEKSSVLKTAGKIVVAVAALLVGAVLEVPAAVSLVVSVLAVLVWGWELLNKGVRSIVRRNLDENALMMIAVIAALILGEYFEAVMVVLLNAIGEWMEEKAVQKSRRDIAEVVNIRPQKANLLDAQGNVREIYSDQIQIGNLLLVRVGERVPVDGVIEEGESSMDQSALTGEAVAVGVHAGDRVLSGSVNLSGAIKVRATAAFADSTASRMIKLVEESSARKGQTERIITRFAKVYTPLVVLAALIVAFVPPLLGLGELREWIMRSLVFLVASCPCALIISVPLGLYSGVGAISKQGVLVKGTKFLEPLAKADVVVLDKTGTLTTGELEVSQAQAFAEQDQALFEQLTAMAESYSAHPIAQAILRALPQPEAGEVSDLKEIAGKGVSMMYDGKQLLCGSSRLLEEAGIEVASLPKANVYTAYDGKVLGSVILSDRPRQEAAQAVKDWKAAGITQTVMLTGDSALSAQRVKEKCGIDNMYTDLLPQDKLEKLSQLKQQGKKVLFVGDGINDAPVLAEADVGIAMGLGTDAAIEAADAVLMSEKLTSLTNAMTISRRALRVVHFNIWFILIIKLVVFALGIAGMANMWMAVFADVGVSILAVLNAVRILKFKK